MTTGLFDILRYLPEALQLTNFYFDLEYLFLIIEKRKIINLKRRQGNSLWLIS